jgi:hypothetical protein
VKSIPVPAFSVEQIGQLADLQKALVVLELEEGPEFAQDYLDRQIIDVLRVPENIVVLVKEFFQLRIGLVSGGTRNAVQRVQQRPDQQALAAYAHQLAKSLDAFLDSSSIHHRVTIEQSPDLICCTVAVLKSAYTFESLITDVPRSGQAFHRLQQYVQQKYSQWVYVQRGLKIVEPSGLSLYKMPHLINWTRTQAMNDADDIITEILSLGRRIDVR